MKSQENMNFAHFIYCKIHLEKFEVLPAQFLQDCTPPDYIVKRDALEKIKVETTYKENNLANVPNFWQLAIPSHFRGFLESEISQSLHY